MPLRFSGLTAEVFFWIFLALLAAAGIGALIFAFLDKQKYTAAGLSAAMLFLGLLIVCLAPTLPLVYCACFLEALGILGQALPPKFAFRLSSLMLSAFSQGLAVVQICFYFPFKMPAAAIAVLLPPLLALGCLRLFYLLRRRCDEFSFRISELVSVLSGAVFAGVLIFELTFYYAAILLFAGYLYLLAEKSFPLKEGKKFGRSFFKTGFTLIGSFLVFFSLALCVSA